MAEDSTEKVVPKNGLTNRICSSVDFHNITDMDISAKNIDNIDSIVLPANLMHLNLSRNKLAKVPVAILNLEKLKVLNISHNDIEFFDESPAFCHTLEHLDLSNNKLKGPPSWVWYDSPRNLATMNLSCNPTITTVLIHEYLEELLNFPTNIEEVDLHDCQFQKHTMLFTSFPKLKRITLGSKEFSYHNSNSLIEAPSIGLEKCCDIERLNLCNTHLYTISSNIEVFKNLVELDLSENYLHSLPNEFCHMFSLEICVLSYNKLLYLPDNMNKLTKLKTLLLDCNELCMIPENICNLLSLKTLDLYNNHLNEIPNYKSLIEFDIAQNYIEEPSDNDYLDKKSKLRFLYHNRLDGRKPEVIKLDDDYSSTDSEDECYEICLNNTQELDKPAEDHPSSPEDWDSDEYWIPCSLNPCRAPSQTPWLYFVKQKMEEGNFCPMDAHTLSVSDKVKYDKLCNPEDIYESDGQFDDYSSDDS